MPPTPFFVEILTLSVFLQLWNRRRQLSQGRRGVEIYVLYRTSPAAGWLAARLGWSVREMEFDFWDDVRLADGSCAKLEVAERAPGALVKRLETRPAYRKAIRLALRAPAHEPYAEAYLAKRIGYELGAAVRSVVVSGWYAREHLGRPAGEATLLLRDGWLSELIGQYGFEQGIRVESWIKGRGCADTLLTAQPGRGSERALPRAVLALVRRLIQFRIRSQDPAPGGGARVAAEMYLNGTRTSGPYNSDLFWYRGGRFSAGDVMAYFRHPKDQPRGQRALQLRQQGITPVGRIQMARWKIATPGGRGVSRSAGLAAAVGRALEDFYQEYDLWRGFCRATGARIHVSTYKQFPENEPRHAAFRDAGGLSVTIQRSVEREPHLFRRTVVDVHFGHGREKARIERDSGSRISQFVISGYPFDHAFPDACRHGLELRDRLRRLGVKFIVCYLDQNEGAHRKTMGGRNRIQEDYRFLCDKMTADPELGLLLKPKRPKTLAARLGPVWDSLDQLVRLGRCIILEESDPDRSTLPCMASTGADVAVNLLYGVTAGLESWLSGTRTLLLAAHGADPGVFSRLPAGSVLFDSWPELWKAVERLREDPAHPAIGNWDPVIEDFVGLRDGRAAERIGQHIAWLQEALRCGKSAEEALQEAGARYKLAWGNEWIFSEEALTDAFPAAR